MTLSLAADIVVALLLIATIFYAIKLNRRLAALRGDKSELQTLVQSLSGASQHAEASVGALKAVAEDVGRHLEKQVEQAQALREDLRYMMERGGALADRLETSLRGRRDEAAPEPLRPRPPERPRAAEPILPERRSQRAATPPAPSLGEERAASGAPSRAERNLLRVLAGRR